MVYGINLPTKTTIIFLNQRRVRWQGLDESFAKE
jgi:hypothetical protein